MTVYRDEVRFGLSFEERMSISPQLSRLRADAQRRADEIYDPFRSREDAARNEEYGANLYLQSKDTLLTERHLSNAELLEIIAEYQASLGADLR